MFVPHLVDVISEPRLARDPAYENGSAFVDDEYCPLNGASIPLVDFGFIHADATYDVVPVSQGQFFRLQDHLDRFASSLVKFSLRCPYTDAEMTEIFTGLLDRAGLRSGLVWWCVTRGVMLGRGAYQRGDRDAYANRFYAYATPYSSIARREQRQRGLNLWVSQKYIRIPPEAVDPTAKNFHLGDTTLALFEARDEGADWAVLTDRQGYLTECHGANVFVVTAGEIYTPDSGCLLGITRASVPELAAELNIRAHERKVHAEQLRHADDAFITSSAGGVIPVAKVDGVLLGGVEGPGQVAARIHNYYWQKRSSNWKSTRVVYG